MVVFVVIGTDANIEALWDIHPNRLHGIKVFILNFLVSLKDEFIPRFLGLAKVVKLIQQHLEGVTINYVLSIDEEREN